MYIAEGSEYNQVYRFIVVMFYIDVHYGLLPGLVSICMYILVMLCILQKVVSKGLPGGFTNQPKLRKYCKKSLKFTLYIQTGRGEIENKSEREAEKERLR